MLKACRYCGRIHEKNFVCDRQQNQKRKYMRSESERGRYTSAFARKSREIKERSFFLCSLCLAEGKLNSEQLETHHIVKLNEAPSLLCEDSNLICLCQNCHRKAEAGLVKIPQLRALVARREAGTLSDLLPDPTPPRG